MPRRTRIDSSRIVGALHLTWCLCSGSPGVAFRQNRDCGLSAPRAASSSHMCGSTCGHLWSKRSPRRAQPATPCPAFLRAYHPTVALYSLCRRRLVMIIRCDFYAGAAHGSFSPGLTWCSSLHVLMVKVVDPQDQGSERAPKWSGTLIVPPFACSSGLDAQSSPARLQNGVPAVHASCTKRRTAPNIALLRCLWGASTPSSRLRLNRGEGRSGTSNCARPISSRDLPSRFYRTDHLHPSTRTN